MQTKTTTEAARTIGQTVFEAQRGPIMLTARDHDVAVLVSAADWKDILIHLVADGAPEVLLRFLRSPEGPIGSPGP